MLTDKLNWETFLEELRDQHTGVGNRDLSVVSYQRNILFSLWLTVNSTI